jgi:hypothetical protein
MVISQSLGICVPFAAVSRDFVLHDWIVNILQTDIIFQLRFMNSKLGLLLLAALGCSTLADEGNQGFTELFSQDGVPSEWMVRRWDDISKPAEKGAVWKKENGVLQGSIPRGTWLISQKEYGDFILEFEWKLGERGNSGTALRAPLRGDPAFDGLELQMVDPRYYGETKVPPAELTGSLYKAVAPRRQLYKPGEWNQYRITCRGPLVKVVLNGEMIVDVDLDQQTTPTKRHDGTDAPPLKDRPRKGHLGFQELSRSGRVEIRNARIKTLE